MIKIQIDKLKRQGMKFVDISLSVVSFQFTHCHISEKNIIDRDIREICMMQEQIQDDISKILSQMKLLAWKSILHRQLKSKTSERSGPKTGRIQVSI